MHDWLTIIAAFIGAWIGLQLIVLGITTVNILRTPIWPIRVRRNERLAAVPPRLSLDQEAALDEIRQLGFEMIWLGHQDIGPRSLVCAFLRHTSLPAYAGITFQASPYVGYPVAFYSFDAQDRFMVTSNRAEWARSLFESDVVVFDPYTNNLLAHWQAHQERLDQAKPIDVDQARERVWSNLEGQFERMQRARLIAPSGDAWHRRLPSAFRTAVAAYRVRRKLASPYVSLATTAENRPGFFVACYEEMEQQLAGRSPRQNVKATVLILSLIAALILWGVVLDWGRAVALVAVIVIHEFGHAIAMRALGWTDLSMFFVPFLGAIVTGKPSEAPAWKQAIVLWAGPLPGLIAGVALSVWLGNAPNPVPTDASPWRDVAIIAISVNLFNLLPITPLDGGRLVEIALFNRWPRLRGVFALVSVAAFVALALWVRSPALWVIIALLVFGLRSQWRAAQLQSAWQDGLGREQQLLHLFGVMEKRLHVRAFMRQWALVRSVFTHRLILKPRLWESLVTVSLLLAVWAGPAIFAFQAWGAAGGAPYRESRTPAQRAFDEALYLNEDDDSTAQTLQLLEQRAQALAPSDPRQIDLKVAEANAATNPERQQRIDEILRQGKDGNRWSIDGLVRSELGTVFLNVADLPATERGRRLRASVEWAERLAPTAIAPTIDARLRVAEALDDGGDPNGALAMLTDLRRRAEAADDCRCEVRSVARAQAWFHLSHGAADKAMALLQHPPLLEGARAPNARRSMDLAWALLLSGQTDHGLAQMRSAAYSHPHQSSWLQRFLGSLGTGARLDKPLDLAFALRRAGRDAEARAVAASSEKWQCDAVLDGVRLYENDAPWQRERDRLILETAKEVCPSHGTRRSGTTGVDASRSPG